MALCFIGVSLNAIYLLSDYGWPIIKFILILRYLTTECTFFIILGLVFVHSLAYQDFLKVLNIAHIYTVRLLCIQRN